MLWTTHKIAAHQRGLLTHHGQPKGWLEPGSHTLWGSKADWKMRVYDLSAAFFTKATAPLLALVPESDGTELLVPPEHVAVVTLDGEPQGHLNPGRYIVWKSPTGVVETFLYDTRAVVAEGLPPAHITCLPDRLKLQVLVKQVQRAVVTVDGVPCRWLGPGLHMLWRTPSRPHVSAEVIDLSAGYMEVTHRPELVAVVPKSAAQLLDVQEAQVATLSIQGHVHSVLPPGTYLVWQGQGVSTALFSTAESWTHLPEETWSLMPKEFLCFTVLPYERGLVWVDGLLHPVLPQGRYALHTRSKDVRHQIVDMREQEVQIQGQEVMTADKVTLRLNLLVKWRVEDVERSVQTQESMHNALYSEAQIVARNVIAGASMDSLLEDRHEASRTMRQDLASRATQWGVEIERIDIKDLILPGEMKTLLNQVIEAQKKAEAHVIMRREETSATRSQANTARMLENNPMLLRLKELDAMQTMVQSVGQLTVVAGGKELMHMMTTKS